MQILSNVVEASRPGHDAQIRYVVPTLGPVDTSDPEELTPLFGLPLSLLEIAYVFGTIAELPRDATELCLPQGEV